MDEQERRFRLFGSQVRILVGRPSGAKLKAPAIAAIEVEALMRVMDRELSRFDPDSELSGLNRDSRETVPASAMLRLLVSAAVDAAKATGGLVDPTLVGDLEAWGYARSRQDATPIPLGIALAAAPPRAPAAPRSSSRWREIVVDDARGSVTRPPGVRIDSGGSGKGLAADLAASRLRGYDSFVVDCGGDVRIGGVSPPEREVEVLDPCRRLPALRFHLASGAVATSGIGTRSWWHRGRPAHHLIDPATGEPAWTGLLQITALAPTAREAETIAKAAFLEGPAGARERLAARGGVIVHDDGRVEAVGDVADLTPIGDRGQLVGDDSRVIAA